VIAKTDQLLAMFRAFLADVPDELVQGFLPAVDAAREARPLVPKTLPCLRHLDRAASIAPARASPLAAWLSANCGDLAWGQTYTAADFGQRFIDNYGWVELIGTRGHLASDTLAAGFLLLGSDLDYPDHHHVAEEVYIPLTADTLWRKGEAAYAERDACEVIHHPSNVNHAMRTRAEPLLALYLWRGGPLAQKSVVTG
jgi:hypothetical protein